MRRITHWSFTDSTERDAEATVQNGDVCTLLDGSFFVRSAGAWVAVGGGGGGGGAYPGRLDFTGAAFGSHFDALTPGTPDIWPSAVGPDLQYLSGNAPALAGASTRRYAYFQSGQIGDGTSDPSLRSLGDVTVTVVIKIIGTPTGRQAIVVHGNQGETQIANANYELEMGLTAGAFSALHEYAAGANSEAAFTGTSAPNPADIGSGWHAITIYRDTTQLRWGLVVDGCAIKENVYVNQPDGGTDGYLAVGSFPGNPGTNYVLGMAFAGLRVSTYLETMDDIMANHARALGGTP